jgi:hypothetical protein
MASKLSDSPDGLSRTTATALAELAAHAIDLLDRNQLDPRFARKLWKRLSNEAECIVEHSDAQKSALDETIDRLKTAVTNHQAEDFVHAAAALRETTENKPGKARS